MLFKISHIQENGTMAAVETVEALNKYEAYVAYLEKHVGVHPLNIVQADDSEAVKAITKAVMARSKEDKTMKTNSAVNTAKATKKASKKTAPKAETVKKTAVKKTQAQPEAVGVKATFELNEEHKGIEIKFKEKPSKEVRAEMKASGFRWHKTRELWYAKQSAETIALAERLCGVKAEPKAQKTKKTAKKSEPKAQAKAQTKAQPKAEVKAEEPKAPAKKPSRKGIESYKPKDGERICDRLIKALERTEGFKVELIKKYEDKPAWLWVSGDATREHKDTLKKLGFFWSGPKQAWYLSPEKVKSNYKSQFKSMDAVRAAAIA